VKPSEGETNCEDDESPTPNLPVGQSRSRFTNNGEALSSSIHIPLRNILQAAACDNVDFAKTGTTVSQKVEEAEDTNAPVGSPKVPFANDSARSIEPHPIVPQVPFADDSVIPIEGHPVDAPVPFANDSAITIEPHPIKGTGEHASNEKSSVIVVEETAENILEVHRGDELNKAEMSAQQALSTAKVTQAPDWLKRMLAYLQGVSDSTEWHELVLALVKFENMNPPSGVGALLLN
jgi:hypothetical protein